MTRMIDIPPAHPLCTWDATLALALSPHDLWVMLAAVLAAVACGTLGCFLVLRRLSLLGDAISHSVLPGLAVAFLLTRTRDIGPMLAGAGVAGLLAAVLSAALSRFGRVTEDASLGVVFTTMFSLGVVLIAFVPSVDLDPGCVLYGVIDETPLDTIALLGLDIPRFVRTISIVLVVNLVLMAVLWKEFKLVSFDAALAVSMGFSAAAIHYVLMAAVAWTSVACFEAVGSILVVAMLIAPGATAHLLTDRYGRLFVYSALLAASSAVIGYQLASALNTTAAGMMSVVSGAQFAVVALVAPRHGVLAKVAARVALSLRVRREDILGALFRRAEAAPSRTGSSDASPGFGVKSARTEVPGGLLTAVAIALLRRTGHVTRDGDGVLALSATGVEAGRRIVRSHRMWESFLSEEAGLDPDHLHDPSHRMEHFITPDMSTRLQTTYAGRPDPHGKPVPPQPPAAG